MKRGSLLLALVVAIVLWARWVFAMPGEASTYGANIGLDHLTGRANAWTAASRTTYLSLARSVAGGGTAPTDAAAGTELLTAGYARQAVTWSAPAGDPSSTDNVAAITFGPFTADPEEVGYCELWDAATNGNRLFWWALDAAKNAAIDESIQFAIGALVATMD